MNKYENEKNLKILKNWAKVGDFAHYRSSLYVCVCVWK